MSGDRKYATVSIPMGIIREMDRLIEEFGYWPSRGAFVREAALEKIRDERRRLREIGETRAKPVEGGEKEEKR